jgi:hypothetical protein
MRLEIKLSRFIARDTSVPSEVFGTSTNLYKVSLERMNIDAHTWTVMSDGLRANPHISHLALTICWFDEDSAAKLLRGTNGPSSALQHIQRLDLSKCTFRCHLDRIAIARGLANMLGGSQVRHVALDDSMLRPESVTHFFDNLSHNDNSSTAHTAALLHTVELSQMQPSVLEIIADCLPRTVRLRRLNIGISLRSEEDDTMLVVPKVFLSSLKRNGSLRSVHVKFDRFGSATANRNKRVKRFFRACMKRNRALSNAISALFETKHAHHVTTGSGTSNTAHPKTMRLPTLYASAMQAPQMAPHNVLIGLLAASKQAVGRLDGKRSGRPDPLHSHANTVNLCRFH